LISWQLALSTTELCDLRPEAWDMPMPICSSCGATNREDARFCYQCAARIARDYPSPADRAWLAATLTARLASPSEAPTQPQRAINTTRAEAPLTEDQGAPMDQTHPPTMEQPTPLFAERYEIVAQLAAVAPAIKVRATFGAKQLAGLVRGRPTSPAALPRLAIDRLDVFALLRDDLIALGEQWRRLLHCRRLCLIH